MIPKKLVPILFGLIVSGLMSFVVSGVSTYASLGEIHSGIWISNWLKSWAVAFPTILIVAPLVRNMLGKLVAK